jgi:DNA/RNA-binding domain of Phe-tRNA-synthetase-like protein
MTDPISNSTAASIRSDDHPSLRFGAFETELPAPLAEIATPPWLEAFFRLDADAPLRRDEGLRQAIRDMLRHGGYKPTGRGKPASEYLVRAAEEGTFPRINLAVDACNAVSLHSGFPISVVDADLARPPYRIAVASDGTRYLFNPAGQEIDASGLVCLFDAEGPSGTAVKDAHRTKTHAGTRRTLSVVWGCAGHEDRLERTVAWYREILERAGARTRPIPSLTSSN